MKQLLIVLTACIPLWVGAQEKVDERFSLDGAGELEFIHVSGKAVFKVWDKNEIWIKGQLDDRAEGYQANLMGDNRVYFKVSMPRHTDWNDGWRNRDGDDLEIYLPANTRLFYHSVNADVFVSELTRAVALDMVNGEIDASKLAGDIRMNVVNGRIRAKALKGNVALESVNGQIDASDVSGESVTVTTVNGDVELGASSRKVEAESVNGDVELILGNVDQLTLNTVNGEIDTKLSLNDNARVNASSVSGDFVFTFDEAVSAAFDIEGHAGGNFKNRLTNDRVVKAKYGPRRALNFVTRSGSAKVRVSTVSGRVELKADALSMRK